MTNPTGDALAAHERVVEAVAGAIMEMPDRDPSSLDIARIAIAAYRKAMEEEK